MSGSVFSVLSPSMKFFRSIQIGGFLALLTFLNNEIILRKLGIDLPTHVLIKPAEETVVNENK